MFENAMNVYSIIHIQLCLLLSLMPYINIFLYIEEDTKKIQNRHIVIHIRPNVCLHLNDVHLVLLRQTIEGDSLFSFYKRPLCFHLLFVWIDCFLWFFFNVVALHIECVCTSSIQLCLALKIAYHMGASACLVHLYNFK